MVKNKNNCYECRHREKLSHSAHSACKVINNEGLALAFAMKVASGEFTGLDNDEGQQVLKFHPHGVRNGWCSWPVNFDPTWVECHLPIDDDKNQNNGE